MLSSRHWKNTFQILGSLVWLWISSSYGPACYIRTAPNTADCESDLWIWLWLWNFKFMVMNFVYVWFRGYFFHLIIFMHVQISSVLCSHEYDFETHATIIELGSFKPLPILRSQCSRCQLLGVRGMLRSVKSLTSDNMWPKTYVYKGDQSSPEKSA